LGYLNTIPNTSCIRCGKLRIESKKWEEYVGKSLVVFTSNICPDPLCQKIVDGNLKDRKDYLEHIQEESLKRRAANRRNRKFKKPS